MKMGAYFFGWLFISLISCDTADVENIKLGDCYVKSISYFDNSPDTEYDFDANGNLIEARQLGALDCRVISTKTYTYNEQKKVKTSEFNGILVTTFFYENDLLVRTETKNKSGNITSSQTIEQNSSNKLIEKLVNNDYKGKITHVFSYDSEGNCTKIEGFNKDKKPLYVRTNSGFVSGKNAYSAFKGLPFRPFEFIIGEIPVLDFPINFGKTSKYQTDLKLLETANQDINNPTEIKERFSTRYKYTFNKNGFPVVSKAYDVTGGKPASFNGDRNYVYSTCN